MGSRAKKRTRVLETEVDRLSSLPDDLIHKILSFLDAKEALQTSVLSKRWKLVWTTLPFLNFGEYEHSSSWNTSGFINHVMKHSSRLIKKLTLGVKLEDFASESDRWDLPALTYLRLKRPGLNGNHNLPDSCLTCLPALRTLCLDNWDFSKSSFSFSLPDLTTLRLSGCTRVSRRDWNFPALLSLELDNVVLTWSCMYKLVKLQNLTLTSVEIPGNLTFSFPQLLSLDIETRYSDSRVWIELSAPKLYNFRSVGIFSLWLEAPVLENANMKLQGWFGNLEWIYRKQYYRRFQDMLSQLGNAKNLTFDLESIEAPSMISDNFAGKPSPFCNLKCVKLPHECNESSIPGALRSYLIGGSSVGTIVTAFPRDTIPCTEAVSMIAQNSVLKEPLAAPAKEVDDTQQNIHWTKTIDVDMHVQEEPFVEDSV
ncbi:F-box/LRR-repeat protein At3g26922-like isoform X2 [Daucus carota subsp. sativus]|uniref:F-box/LRR-repeat protein At3g26922-like isoform X2 n=1 Tax=Daucus carota subsp. sativus TaxID=79200 RepID=UPI0030837C97